jgi:proline dehydrogenase
MNVLRRLVLWVVGWGWFRKLATDTWIGRRVAGRFVAGTSLEEAMDVARELNRLGIASMLDHLGENVTTAAEAAAATDTYVGAVKRIHEADELDAGVSVKLTQLGLDQSVELALENIERVLEAAKSRRTMVMIDMEASEYVDRTLEVVRTLRERGHDVGVCLQAMLFRTERDVFELPAGTPIRLVKGAYLEPPDVAHESRAEVDRAFARLFATLVSRGHPVHVASHDPRLIEGTKTFMHDRGASWAGVEYQMLYGIREDIQQALARDHYPVRTYIPYGTRWYPYLTRRLAERPANMWFFASQFLRGRGRGRG